MKKYNTTVIFTCYNRLNKTKNCIESLVNGNDRVTFHFIVVDDASNDGTVEYLESRHDLDIDLIKGNGSLFWCGGMRKGIGRFLEKQPNEDEYCLLVNDDVEFYPHAIDKLFDRLNDRKNTVVVGAVCDTDGNFTYGLKRKEKWYKKNITVKVLPSNEEVVGDTLNANCVLLPNKIVMENGNLDSSYVHSLGDYDYGFKLSRKGIRLISSTNYVGICTSNSIKNTWMDRSLSRIERIRKKESPKGSPFGEWWHFLYKNFGIVKACVYSIIPYVKILLKK